MDLKKLIKYSKEKQWRENNKERFRRYMREYMREYRQKKEDKYVVKSTRKLQSKTPYFFKKDTKEVLVSFD